MGSKNEFSSNVSLNAIETAKSLRNLYFIRTVFSVIWVILLSIFVKTNQTVANVLFIIYPIWDVIATYIDIKSNPKSVSATPQFINMAIAILTAIGVALALQKGVPTAIIVFGIWAIVTGVIQLVLGVRRRTEMNGQWPMVFSGGQSAIAGFVFIFLAHDPTFGVGSLAGYSAFGAFYFLLAAIRLSKTVTTTAQPA